MGVLGELNNTPAGKGPKAKTPLKSKSPGPIGTMSPNNDALEKRRALEASVAANARDDSEDELESPAARRSNTLAADDELAAYSW